MSNPFRVPLPLQPAPRSEPPPARDSLVFCFSLQSVAEPGVLARVLEQLAKRGLLPIKWYSDVGAESGLLQIDIQVARLDREAGEEVARGLRAIVGVEHVLTSVKGEPEGAVRRVLSVGQ
jgi:acetolactate synthase small subunit